MCGLGSEMDLMRFGMTESEVPFHRALMSWRLSHARLGKLDPIAPLFDLPFRGILVCPSHLYRR